MDHDRPWGYQWRSSQTFIIATVSIALLTETLLYGFVVPILGYMLETRLRLDPSQTQGITAVILSSHGFLVLISAPVIAHFADKTPNRKSPLLISLVVCILGTILVAAAPNLWVLFLGRVLQGLSGSAAWIVCFATLTDTVDPKHINKIVGVTMSLAMSGDMAGPLVAGALLEIAGYWFTWCFPLAVLALDLIARLIMIENRHASSYSFDSPATTSPSSSPVSDEESSTLLSSSSCDYESTAYDAIPDGSNSSSGGFYRVMLLDARVLVGVVNTVLLAAIVAGFNTTLPLHLRRVFNWGTLPVGMMFLALQIPPIILGPAVGVLRDRVGLRTPTALGWLLMAPLLWLLGVPGVSHYPWANPAGNGKAIFIASMVGIGTVSSLLRSGGVLQITAVAREMQEKNLKILGEHGGSSRVFSLAEVSYNLGLMMGPLISGLLTETVGYYYMNTVLAAISLVIAVLSFWSFDSGNLT